MLILSVLSILCSNAVAIRRDKSILYARTVISVLICCLMLSYNNNYIDFLSNGIGLFHGFFHTSSLTHTFHIFIILISLLIVQLNSFYPRKLWTNNFSSISKLFLYRLVYFNSFILNKMSEQFRILEYPLIILFVIIGGVFLISCSDLISVFIAIELQSYGLYILCSIYRESEKATSAGLTYFLLGGLSSCFILFASSLLYGNSGNTSFDGIYIISSVSNLNYDMSSIKTIFSYSYDTHYINVAFIIMSVGFLFKVTAAPFHFWSPDVYDAIPTVVTTFVAIFAKISIFLLILELVYYTSNMSLSIDSGSNNISNISWKFTLLISALISFIIGSILGMTQFRIKRLYAYSTISHVGFILLGLSINSIESIQSFMFYLMQYSLSNLNAFMLLISIGYSLYLYVEKSSISTENISKLTPVLTDKKNSPIQLISQLTGFFHINPVLSISLGITIFSFVGVPPLIGFFGKQMVLSSALDSGYVFMTLVAILTSVISAYYYLSLIKQIFFDKSNYVINPQIENLNIKGKVMNNSKNVTVNSINMNNNNIVLSSSLSITISVLTLVILLFILSPQEWLSMINILSLVLFDN